MQLERITAKNQSKNRINAAQICRTSFTNSKTEKQRRSRTSVKATLAAFKEMARYVPALVSTLVLHYHLQLDAILLCIKHSTFTQTNEMNESRMRSSSRCTSSIKTRLGYCRTIQLRWLLTCLAMIAIQDETDEGCEQQSTADATPSHLPVGVLVVFDAYSSGETKKRRIAGKYNNKANCFSPRNAPLLRHGPLFDISRPPG